MNIKILMDVPEHEDSGVQALAVERRIRELVELMDVYPFKSHLFYADGSGVEIVPETLVSQEKKGSPEWAEDLQGTIGGLVLELRTVEKYWNKPSSYEHLEKELYGASHATPWEVL